MNRLITGVMVGLAVISLSACSSTSGGIRGQTLVGVAKIDNVTKKPFTGDKYCDYKDQYGRAYQSPCS